MPTPRFSSLGHHFVRWIPADGMIRRGVECLFADTRTRRLNLEDTHITAPGKRDTLLAIVALAVTWAYRSATTIMRRGAIRRKTHGRREKSWFRIGLDALRKWLGTAPDKAMNAWLQTVPKRVFNGSVVYCGLCQVGTRSKYQLRRRCEGHDRGGGSPTSERSESGAPPDLPAA